MVRGPIYTSLPRISSILNYFFFYSASPLGPSRAPPCLFVRVAFFFFFFFFFVDPFVILSPSTCFVWVPSPSAHVTRAPLPLPLIPGRASLSPACETHTHPPRWPAEKSSFIRNLIWFVRRRRRRRTEGGKVEENMSRYVLTCVHTVRTYVRTYVSIIESVELVGSWLIDERLEDVSEADVGLGDTTRRWVCKKKVEIVN